MHVHRHKDTTPEEATGPAFTGEVYRHVVPREGATAPLNVNLVKFEAGGRTTWHTHTFEQILVIVEGKGIVATEHEEYVVEPGDVLTIPVDENHWHGGTNTTAMAHIAINGHGQTIPGEPVTEIKTRDL